VDLRGAGNRFQIITAQSDTLIGEIDDYRAFRETHPGAVYLHKGDTFVVKGLDLNTRTVTVSKAQVNYYTRVRGYKLTEILDIKDKIFAFGTSAYIGKIKVTDQVTEYETWRIRSKTLVARIPLELPPQIFETEGLWFQIPQSIQQKCESKHFDLMGGLHAIEHAAIGIFPLLVMADHKDVGGLSTDYHPQVGSAVIFIYDGIPGGAGLTRRAFADFQRLCQTTLQLLGDCPCETGCPSCVQSPQCGSGNRPMDKNGAIFILNQLAAAAQRQDIAGTQQPQPGKIIQAPDGPFEIPKIAQKTTTEKKVQASQNMIFGVFDLETQGHQLRSAI
jgi:DEAD/DEAH box helicase domain-containing protein